MKHRLFILLSGCSLLICVSMAGLWVRSYFAADGWSWSDGMRVPTAGYSVAWRNAIISEKGSLYFIRDRSMGGVPYARRLTSIEIGLFPRVDEAKLFIGVGYQSKSGYPAIASLAIGPPVTLTRVWAVPYWLIVIVTALPPTLLSSRHRNRLLSGLHSDET